MKYAYCSALNCKYSQLYGTRQNGSSEPMQKFCPMCGAAMIGKCPSCEKDRDSMEYKFCPDCGKTYK